MDALPTTCCHNFKLPLTMFVQSGRSVSTAMTGERGRPMNANQPMTALLPAPSCAQPSCAKPDFAKPDCAKPDCGKPDIVRRFLAWAQSADAEARADGASALARAYLYSELTAPVRAEAALAMTALLDDPSVLVRRALAGALCRAREAPRTLILALAADEPG